MTTYRIIHHTLVKTFGETVFKSNIFNQEELQTKFDELVKKLEPGEEAEYMKEDDKYFYPAMQLVINENGTLYRYTPQGSKREYKCK